MYLLCLILFICLRMERRQNIEHVLVFGKQISYISCRLLFLRTIHQNNDFKGFRLLINFMMYISIFIALVREKTSTLNFFLFPNNDSIFCPQYNYDIGVRVGPLNIPVHSNLGYISNLSHL